MSETGADGAGLHMTPTTLHHLTLNTGHVSVTSPADVDITAMAELRPIVSSGGGSIPGTDLRLTLFRDAAGWDGCTFVISHGLSALVTCYLAWEPDGSFRLWSSTMDYLGVEGVRPPKHLPWLAVLLWPRIVHVPREVVEMLGDIERCVAAEILTQAGFWPVMI